MSALRSSAGPAVWMNATSSSSAMIRARLTSCPSPGGPASRTWSSASPRAAAARIEISSWAFSASWPTNSSSRARAQPRLAARRLRAGAASGCARGRRRGCGSSARDLQGVGDQGLRRVTGRRRRAARRPPAALKPRPIRPSRASACGSSVRVMTIGSSMTVAPTFSRSSTMIRSAVRLPMPGNGLQARGVAARDRRPAARAAGRRRAPRAPSSGRRSGRRAAAGTGPAPPRWRSRRAAARRRARSGG